MFIGNRIGIPMLGSSGVAALPSIGGVSNFTRATMTRALPAFTGMKAGANDVTVPILGDSITAGFGGTGSDSPADATTWAACVSSYASNVIAASSLNSAGVLASSDSFNNSYAVGAMSILLAADTRITLPVGTGWVTVGSGTFQCLGLKTVGTTLADTTSTILFTPAGTVSDTVDLWFAAGPSGRSSIFYTIDGGAENPTPISTTAASNSIKKVTISLGSTGAHSIKLRNGSAAGATGVLFTVSFRNSTNKSVMLWNWGWSSGNSGTGASGVLQAAAGLPWNSVNSYYDSTDFGHQLILLNLSINDMAFSTDPAPTVANWTTIVTNAHAAGIDVILVVPAWVSTASTPTSSYTKAVQQAYETAIIALGVTLGCPVIDLKYGFADFAAWQGAGYAGGSEHLHPNAAGLAYIGGVYSTVLQALYAAA